jgi:endonuclease/exonuclease/phosphatase family metal-dependent hydrolase
MFHGRLDRETAQGIKVLRKRINAAGIPSSRLDETIILATWNIREFGKKRRTAAAIHYIAEILGQFDLIAVTELRDNLSDLKRVMEILGPYWNVVFSDFNSDARGNRERVGYLFDKRAVVFSGLAAEPEPPRKKDPKNPGESVPAITWWRSPYMASFRAGNFDFILLTAHIRWGDGDKARIPPLKLLASWVDKRRKGKNVVDKDWIVMGDFNIPKVSGPLFDAVTSKGLSIPAPFLNVANKKLTSNLSRNKRYDQILHYSRETFSITGKAGVLDFYDNDWRGLFPAAKFPGMTKNKFTFQLSDHLPLWVELNLRVDEEQLDQMLNRNKQ